MKRYASIQSSGQVSEKSPGSPYFKILGDPHISLYNYNNLI